MNRTRGTGMAFGQIFFALWIGLIVSPAFASVISLKGKPAFVQGEVLVRFNDDVKSSDRDKVLAVGASRMSIGENVYKMKLSSGADVLKMVENLRGSSGVSYVQPNYKYYALGSCPVPANSTDQYYSAPYNWPLTIIQVPQAWSQIAWPSCPPGAGVTVAVLDTGISRFNPDLRNVPLIGYNAICALDEEDPSCNCSVSFTESAGVTTTMDDFGHGTWVSGIIAATWNAGNPISEAIVGDCNNGNTTGMAGLAGGAVIMPIKVLDCTGSGSSDVIAAGINYAVAHGAKVLNLSLGGSQDSLDQEAVNNALAAGCVVVAASGNESNLPGTLAPLDYPAGYPGVLAVGASDQNDHVAFYSNGGSGLDGKILDLVAPGGINAPDPSLSFTTNAAECIFSTFVCPLPSAGVSDGGFMVFGPGAGTDTNYGLAAGTSGATPFVTATAALLFSLNPTWTNTQVVQQIINNTDSLDGNSGWNSETGYGRLNVYKALSSSLGQGQTTTYVKTFNSPNPFYLDEQLYTNITLVMTRPEAVQLTIYDTSGEIVLNKNYAVSQLNSNPNNPQYESYYIAWDGKNGSGQKVKTGIYFYTVNVGGQVSHNKIAVIQGPQ
jgi:subtilisin family serine protease